MHVLGYLGLTAGAIGAAAWSACVAAKRFDQHFPAPANDVSGFDGGADAARLPIGLSMTTNALRQGLPELPQRMRALPLDSRGFPVPYFVEMVDGKPDYRRFDGNKLAACVYYKRCWICGDQLGQYKAFVINPLASVTRESTQPPSHVECAKFVAQASVFIDHQPDVVLVWVTRTFKTEQHDGGLMFSMGDAEQTIWYAGGRLANRDEVRAALEHGLPTLYETAIAEGEAAVLELDTKVARATRVFPPHAVMSCLSGART